MINVKQWHNSVSLTIIGEHSSVTNTATKAPQQNIFDVDESALFYNVQSNRTLEMKKRKNVIIQQSTKISWLLLSCSMEGREKLQKLVIGKFEKP